MIKTQHGHFSLWLFDYCGINYYSFFSTLEIMFVLYDNIKDSCLFINSGNNNSVQQQSICSGDVTGSLCKSIFVDPR